MRHTISAVMSGRCTVQCLLFTASRTGRYGAGWPGRSLRSWHAWRTGTPARLAAARMQATAANRTYCQKSSVCHQATSSSRSSSVPPRRAAAASTTYWNIVFCRPRKVHSGRNRSCSPSRGSGSAWLARASPARRRRRGGTPRRGRCCLVGAGAQARSPARRGQRRGRALRAGHAGRSRCPRGRPLPGRHIPTVRQDYRPPGGIPAGVRSFVTRFLRIGSPPGAAPWRRRRGCPPPSTARSLARRRVTTRCAGWRLDRFPSPGAASFRNELRDGREPPDRCGRWAVGTRLAGAPGLVRSAICSGCPETSRQACVRCRTSAALPAAG